MAKNSWESVCLWRLPKGPLTDAIETAGAPDPGVAVDAAAVEAPEDEAGIVETAVTDAEGLSGWTSMDLPPGQITV